MASVEWQRDYYLKHKLRLSKEHAAYYVLHKEDWLHRQAKNKECISKHHEVWARNNRDKINASTRKCRQANKVSAMNMYSNGDACCRWCGQADIDVLCLDHINDDGAKQRKGRDFYLWLQKNDYPAGLQVLCSNCNLKKELCRARGERIFAGGGAVQ